MANIPEFYNDKNVFMTGGTGFLGKVTIEKLLRSCPNIRGIYCLVRPKRGQSAQERLKAQFTDKLYDKLRSEQPNFTEKVHAIHGDILEDDLGIKQKDVEFLESNIHIVFHSAATVRFDEHLRLAVQMNVLGVRKMIKVCQNFKHLQVFVHVSTAYANCDRDYIEEVFYPSPCQPQKVIDMLEWLDDDMISTITPKLIGKKPNTYTYTKQLAETLLIQEGSSLPLAIVRPSIVTATCREPIPGWIGSSGGWIDNYNGPSGLYIAVGKGILRTFYADRKAVADVIPVDLPVNMMIAVAWYTVVKKPQNAQIYHCTTGGLNPFTWGEMESLLVTHLKNNPLDACFRRPRVQLTTNGFIHEASLVFSHMIPAYLADFGYLLLGKKPRMVSIYQKLHKAMNTLQFFTVRDWEWTHSNMDVLKHNMEQQDQKVFYFDPRILHWPTYLENYVLGTKQYLLKEDLSGLPAARAHLKTLRNIRWAFNTFLGVMIWRFLIAKSQLAQNSWYFIVGLIFKFVSFFKITSTISQS